METKSFPLEVKEVTDSGVFEGYASTFGNRDSYGDVIHAGAFKRTLNAWRDKKNRLPVLWQHNSRQPIGFTLDASEDKRGLAVKGQLLVNEIPQAREAHALAVNNVLGGLSIGFDIPKGGVSVTEDETAPFGVQRDIKEIKLYEYSLVTFPANEEATLDSVKSTQEFSALMSELRELVALLKAARPSSDTSPVGGPPEDDEYAGLAPLAERLKGELRRIKEGR